MTTVSTPAWSEDPQVRAAQSAELLAAEPKRRGARVRDKDGDVWVRGNTRWTCQAPVDGDRVRSVGRLPWYTLVDWYGPVEMLDGRRG